MRLAITGVGSISPLGPNPERLLAGLDAGRRGFSPVDLGRYDPGGVCRSRWAGTVGEFDPTAYLPALRARRLDRASLFAVAAARQAVSAAGLAEDPSIHTRLGVVLGTSSAGSGPLITFLEALFTRSPEAAPPFEFPNTVANAPASHISIELKLEGPNVTLAQKQSVMAPALLYARFLLADDRCEAVLVGATDEWTAPYQLGYDQLRSLRLTPEPEGSPGMLLGEGATVVAVEAEARAAARGAEIAARVLAVELASAPGETHRWIADAGALERAVRGALRRADLTAAGVGSVILAANGVPAMEDAEAEALSRVFAGHRLAASGIKGAIGEGAAPGATALAVAALARRRRLLPPFAGAHLRRWPQELEMIREPAPLPPGATLLPYYGAGGLFAAVLLG
jgi:3-oxoacyl-[acyl-carrier-protein] synthase II